MWIYGIASVETAIHGVETPRRVLQAMTQMAGIHLLAVVALSRAHGMGSLSVVRRPSFPFAICVAMLSSNLSAFLPNFSCSLPWIWPRLEIGYFEKNNNKKKTFSDFLNLRLKLHAMGTNISKRYSSLKSLLNFFKLLLNFLLSGPHKSTLLDFWNFANLNFFSFP